MARKLIQYITEAELETLRAMVRDDDDLDTKVAVGKLMAAAQDLLNHQTGSIRTGSGSYAQVGHQTLAKVASEYADLRRRTLEKIEARRETSR